MILNQLVLILLSLLKRSLAKKVRESESARLKAAGASLLGLIPEDRWLLTLTVAELAASVRGKLLNSPERSGRPSRHSWPVQLYT